MVPLPVRAGVNLSENDMQTATQAAPRDWDRERAEKQQRDAKIRAECITIARAIARELKADVTIEETEYKDEKLTARLELNGRAFSLYFNGWKQDGRVSVSGYWPSEKRTDGTMKHSTPRDLGAIPYNQQPPSCTMSYQNKTPAQLAKDIRRRFLPEFEPIWDACQTRVLEHEKAGREALAHAQAIVQDVPEASIKPTGDQQYTVRGIGNTMVCSGYGIDFEYRFSGLSAEQARQIIAAIRSNKNAD